MHRMGTCNGSLHPSLFCSPKDFQSNIIALLGSLSTAQHFADAVLPSASAPSARVVVVVVAVVGARLTNLKIGGWEGGG